MKIQPLKGKVVVEVAKSPETINGIHIPSAFLQKEFKGIVTEVPIGDDDCPVKVGEVVIFEKYAAQEIESEGKMFGIIKYEHLTARFEK